MGRGTALLDLPGSPGIVRVPSTALVHVPLDACPCCASALRTEQRIDQPLLRHGGYGAARLTRELVCVERLLCGWRLLVERSEMRP